MFCLNLHCKQDNTSTDSQIETQAESTQYIEKSSILTTFTKDEYIDDLNQLINVLNENHPRLYEFITKDKFDALVEEKIALINDNFKVGEFTWLCRSIISEIGCGHTIVPTIGMNYFLPDSLLFPIKVNYIDDKLFVLNPLKNEELVSIGDEIISINRVNVKEIKEDMYKHVSSDACINSLKMEYVNDGFMDYAAFYFKFTNKYEIEFRKDNKIKTITLNQLHDYNEEKAIEGKCSNNLCFEIDKGIAIITIRSFSYYEENFPTFKTFIDSCFNEIKSKQPQNLIIDLRDNGGGDPYCASYLLQHIADKPFQYYKTGTYSYDDLEENIFPHENRFSGKPIILINGRCFSTTGHLCALIKANNFGIFVGKETGATFICNASVRPFVLTNTQVTAYIATKTYEVAVSTLPKDKGIIPQHELKGNISDLLNDKDVDLEFTFNLILNE